MATTRINVTEVVNSLPSINSAQSTVSNVAWGIAATSGGVDATILARNGIGWRLNSVQAQVAQIAQKLQAISDATSSGAMLYGQTEAAIATLGSQMGFISSKNSTSKGRSKYEDYFMDSPEKVKQTDTKETAVWAKAVTDLSEYVKELGVLGIATSGAMNFGADLEGGMSENEAWKQIFQGTAGFTSAFGLLAENAYKASNEVNVKDVLLGKWETNIWKELEIEYTTDWRKILDASVENMDKRFNFNKAETVGDKINVAAEWVGIAATAVTTGIDNYEEFGTINSERFWEETVLETGIDIAKGAIVSIGVSTIVAGTASALGVTVGIPAALVGVATVGVLWVADFVVGNNTEDKTGERKNVNEVLSDTILDSDIYQEVKGLVKQYGHFETDWSSCYGI